MVSPGSSLRAGLAKHHQWPRIGAQMERDFNLGPALATSLAMAGQACGDDLGVVEHQKVVRAQQIRKVGKDVVSVRRRAVGIDHQQTRGVSRVRRPKGDALGRQIKIKRVDAHQAQEASAATRMVTILSGSSTGSPRLILSTCSMPSTTRPHTVYWPSRNEASSKQMKNWLSALSGLAARAMDAVPRT